MFESIKWNNWMTKSHTNTRLTQAFTTHHFTFKMFTKRSLISKMFKTFQLTNFRCLTMTKKIMEADTFAPSVPVNTPLVSKHVFFSCLFLFITMKSLDSILIFYPAKVGVYPTYSYHTPYNYF